MARLYALLVGINDYPAPINKLSGCLNDVENAHSYLNETRPDAAVVVLKDREATSANVIDQFRCHLGQAGKDDVVLFQYCGHGARSTAAPEFNQFDLSGRDEGLVLIDSRLSDSTFDLADKELAMLLAELAQREPHIAVVLDCCHSGSGTRDLAGMPAPIRTTTGKFSPRPIESYLEGQYAAAAKAGTLSIPAGRHILLAACDRSQTAKEDGQTHCGLYTTALFDVLRRSGNDISYADLFVRARAAVRQIVRSKGFTDQDPQFEPVAGFDSYKGVFGGDSNGRRRTYLVTRGLTNWRVDCGAIQGMPTDPSQTVELLLHPEGDIATISGHARTMSVGAQSSVLELDFAADAQARFTAEVSSMPEPPLLVAFEGDPASREAVEAVLNADGAPNVQLISPGADDGFALIVDGNSLRLVQRDSGNRISTAMITPGSSAWANQILPALRHVAQWRRSLTLANAKPQLDSTKVDFVFAEQLPDGSERVHPGSDIMIEVGKQRDGWSNVKGELRVRNRAGQMLNYVLVHFTTEYAVEPRTNEQVEPSDDYQTIAVSQGTTSPQSSDVYFSLDRGSETVEQLKLILSTERVDDFLLALDPLTDTRSFGNAADAPDATKPVTDDWFTKDLRVRLVPRVDEVGATPVILANGQIIIDAHPSFTAGVNLSTALGPARGLSDDAAFVARMAAAGLTSASLSAERSGDSTNVIELTDIINPGSLAQTPLAITIDVPLADGEVVVPLVNDGGHVLPAGDFWRDEHGKTQVRIDRLPSDPVGQRSVGSALRMFLVKAFVKPDRVNRLRWVEKTPDRVIAHADGIDGKVAAAKSILLVIHGIIGDAVPIAEAALNSGIGDHFDLVLAYDYENLSTPIEETARTLRDDLARVGLRVNDRKRLVILAHSMGGLVTRWFVEKEGGAHLVDRIVLCGTPNEGSPFGKVDSARNILMILAGLGLNTAALAPLCGPAMVALAYSKKLTPTLEEMAPHSRFISTITTDTDAGVPITILAGDIDKYQDQDPQFFSELLVKLGRGPAFDALFESASNDLAVAVESIRAIASPPLSKATRMDVACHHFNYFQCDAGLSALKSLDWKSWTQSPPFNEVLA